MKFLQISIFGVSGIDFNFAGFEIGDIIMLEGLLYEVLFQQVDRDFHEVSRQISGRCMKLQIVNL